MNRQKGRAVGVALAGAALVVATLGADAGLAYPRPGRLERVSVASDGSETTGYAAYPSISDDGRFVAFDSDAATLVPGDTNEFNDIFVHDRATHRTERVSVSTDEEQSEAPAYLARISATGRFVIFQSGATNLAPGANGFGSVFLRDLQNGTTELVSMSSDEEAASSLSFPGEIAPDGRYVAFESFASNLVPGDGNDKNDVFIRDRVEGTTVRVSVRADGQERVGDSFSPSISDDGRYVAYTALVGTQGEERNDFIDEMQVFWHDRQTGDVRMVSVSGDGRRGNAFSSDPQISGDGRYVVFESAAQNLVPADANRAADVFVHDTVTTTTRRISVTSSGEESNGRSFGPVLSGDGRHVAFGSEATDLVPGDTNGRKDAFVHDLVSGTTERVSLSSSGQQPGSHSEDVFISAGGRFVAFANYSGLIPEDQNDTRDVFVLDRGPSAGVGGLTATRTGDAVEVSGWATFSGAVAAASRDGVGDAVQGGEELGADLTEASVVYRPESEDLLVRFALTGLPSVRPPQASGLAIGCALGFTCGAGAAGTPTVTYSMSMQIEDTRYEIRAERGASPASASLHLLECDQVCTPTQTLSGSIGVTGDHVVLAVPLGAIGAAPGGTIEAVRAWTGPGHPVAGTATTFDQVELPDAPLPVPTVALHLLPSGSETAAAMTGGRFSGTVPYSPGADGVLARACLGDACGTATSFLSS